MTMTIAPIQTSSLLPANATVPSSGGAQFADTPARWARAFDAALEDGVEIYTTLSGERFASSGTHLDLIYRVTATTCECARAQAGDAVCAHRAALRSVLGTLPVVVLHVDELLPDPIPIHHGEACTCDLCWHRA